MGAMGQLNVRLDYGAKAAGEDSIRAMGVSVTEFMRKLWDKLAQGGEECAAVQRAVLGNAAATSSAMSAATVAGARKSEALVRARALRDAWMEAYGYGPDDLLDVSQSSGDNDSLRHPDRQLAVEALVARMQERGTL